MDSWGGLQQLAPELIWGMLSRGIGFIYLIAFFSLRPQVLVIAGRDGVLPVAQALRAQARDFSGWRRYVLFPTLLWFNSSDLALRTLVWIGIAASASTVVGGPHAPWAFAVCYVAFLSLDRAMTLIYPWESLLFECAVWAVFLPATRVLPSLETVVAPSPAVAWAFRLLAFRVLFGFGKHKFLGSTLQDNGFLRGFLATQPLPNPIGWHAQKLPIAVLKFGLVCLFVVEVVLPFAVFMPGPLATIAAVASIALMLVIFATGNYGHFNFGLIVVLLSWFDHATARRLSLASLATPVGVVFAVHTYVALLALPFNTFCTFTWTMWGAWRRLGTPLFSWPIAFARLLTPWRVVHAYGVFPPNSLPPARVIPVTEVTWDEQTWHELTHRYWPTRETSAPRFCAPHHERFDQAVVYEGMGLNEMSVYRGVIGRWDPYGYGGVGAPQRFMHRMLSGTMPGTRFYDRSLERQHGAPKRVRVRTYMLEPASSAEHAASGLYWKRTLIGPHFPPQGLGDMFVEHPLPPPELWHFEDVYWLERSNLGRAMRQVARGGDPHRFVLADAPELDRALVDAFWTELVPWVAARDNRSFQGLRADVERLRARYDRQRLYAFERIAGRYAALLFARLEPLFNRTSLLSVLRRKPSELGTPSLYELRLLTHHIIIQGREAYDVVHAEPSRAAEHAARANMFSMHALQALFRYEALVYQSQKLRLDDAMTALSEPHAPRAVRQSSRSSVLAKRCFGVLAVAEFLVAQFTEDEHVLDVPEHYPAFAFTKDAEVVRVEASPAKSSGARSASAPS